MERHHKDYKYFVQAKFKNDLNKKIIVNYE